MEGDFDELNLRGLLNEVETYRTQRLFDAKGEVLPIFWYIAVIGYALTLVIIYSSPPTVARCVLASFYSSMVGVVLLGVFVLTHPYSAAAGVEPDIFTWLLETTR